MEGDASDLWLKFQEKLLRPGPGPENSTQRRPDFGFVGNFSFIVRSSELPWPQVAEKWLFGRCDARELADKASGRKFKPDVLQQC
jgi:hypothetical protein